MEEEKEGLMEPEGVRTTLDNTESNDLGLWWLWKLNSQLENLQGTDLGPLHICCFGLLVGLLTEETGHL